MGEDSSEAVFNEVKRLMELRSMTVFLKYVHQLHGENLFLCQEKSEAKRQLCVSRVMMWQDDGQSEAEGKSS